MAALTKTEFDALVNQKAMEILKDTMGYDKFMAAFQSRSEETKGGEVHTHGPGVWSPAQAADVSATLAPVQRAGFDCLPVSGYGVTDHATAMLMSPGLLHRQAPTFLAQTMQRSTTGFRFARLVKAYAQTRNGKSALEEYIKNYGNDQYIEKALAATIGSSGGFLIQEEMAADMIEYLRAFSWVMSMNPMITTLQRGQTVNAAMTTGVTAGYIAENTNSPFSQPVFGEVRLTARKLMVLAALSNDLIRRTDGNADIRVRDDMGAAMSQRQDMAFTRDDGTLDTPKGLRYWAPAASVIAANGTVNLANVTVDLGKLMLALLGNNIQLTRAGWGMAPRSFIYLSTVRDTNGNFAFRDEMVNNGTLWGLPYAYSTNIPITLGGSSSEVYLAAFNEVEVGQVPMVELESYQGGTYYNGATLVSGISTDQTVIVAKMEHDLILRHAPGVAVLTTVNWA